MRYSATGCQQVAKSESGGRGTAARIYFRAAYREGNGQSGRARNRGRRLGAALENRRPPLGWKSRPAASAGDRSRRPGAEGRARPASQRRRSRPPPWCSSESPGQQASAGGSGKAPVQLGEPGGKPGQRARASSRAKAWPGVQAEGPALDAAPRAPAGTGDRGRCPGAEGRARPKASAGRSGAVPGLQGHKTGNRREGTAARIYFRAAKKREGNRAERQASRKTGVFHLPRDIGDKSAVFLHFAKMRNRYSPKTL